MEDPLKANLREESAHFHAFCGQMAFYLGLPEAGRFGGVQLARANEVVKRAMAVKFADSNTLRLHYLTEDERALYLAGFRKAQQVNAWKSRARVTDRRKLKRK
jgi:hypothetical protein